MKLQAAYPTSQHATASEAITRFFTTNYAIEAVMLVNSCARGKATRDSCLDINILVQPDALKAQIKELEAGWARFDESDASIQALKAAGKYSVVHLDFVDGVFTPYEQDEAASPDWFEVSVGNLLAYSVPLWQGSDYLSQVKAQWLPYYNDELRAQRLTKVRWFCLNNLHHIPLYIKRGLYFQSFDRLYNAYQGFLQALFISRRTYPIAYNKWIREQVEEILGEHELYEQLTHLFEVKHFESMEIADKAKEVEALLERYAPAPLTKRKRYGYHP
jgi:predicted nucleotidyltransferase